MKIAMETIIKEISVILTESEINCNEPVVIKLHVHSEEDPHNEEGVTYTISYPKNSEN